VAQYCYSILFCPFVFQGKPDSNALVYGNPQRLIENRDC
jgi:hypothetical protein